MDPFWVHPSLSFSPSSTPPPMASTCAVSSQPGVPTVPELLVDVDMSRSSVGSRPRIVVNDASWEKVPPLLLFNQLVDSLSKSHIHQPTEVRTTRSSLDSLHVRSIANIMFLEVGQRLDAVSILLRKDPPVSIRNLALAVPTLYL